jgi:endonuclease/exonuclease/phosphatase family metal-dependent hydrolase
MGNPHGYQKTRSMVPAAKAAGSAKARAERRPAIELPVASLPMGSSSSHAPAAQPPPAAEADSLTIITWNVWFDVFERDCRTLHVLSTVQAAQPDVACFQEATASFVSALRQNAFLVEHYSVFEDVSAAAASSTRGKPYGALIMCKKQFAAAFSRHELTTLMDRELLVAQLQLGGGRRATVATVHMESLNCHKVRVQQMKEIKRVISCSCPAPHHGVASAGAVACAACGPVILCGDFNFCSESNFGAAPTAASPLENSDLSAIFPEFVDVWPALHASSGEKGYTYDSKSNGMLQDMGSTDPRCRLDRVMLCSARAWRPCSIDLLGTSEIHCTRRSSGGGSCKTIAVFPSDHFGLVAVFKRDGA